MGLRGHNQLDFILGERRASTRPDRSHFRSAKKIENYTVNSAGHLERRGGLVNETEFTLTDVETILPFYNSYIVLTKNKDLTYLRDGALRFIPFFTHTFVEYDNNFGLVGGKDASEILFSNISFNRIRPRIKFIQAVGNDIYIYTDDSLSPHVLYIDKDRPRLAPLYADPDGGPNLYNLLRSFPLDPEDLVFDDTIFSDSEEDQRDKIKLFLNSDADLNKNTCVAWLGVTEEEVAELNGKVDINKMGLKEYFGRPLFFNILPTLSEFVGGDKYSISYDQEGTSYTSTLLQNLDKVTGVSNFATTEVNRREIIKQLLYGRKYCIIPTSIHIDSSITDDGELKDLSTVVTSSNLITPATTRIKTTSEVLKTIEGIPVPGGTRTQVDFRPREHSTTYSPAETKSLGEANFELRLDGDRLKQGADFTYYGSYDDIYMDWEVKVHGDRLTVEMDQTDREEPLRPTEGLFLNGVRRNDLFGRLGDIEVILDLDDIYGHRESQLLGDMEDVANGGSAKDFFDYWFPHTDEGDGGDGTSRFDVSLRGIEPTTGNYIYLKGPREHLPSRSSGRDARFRRGNSTWTNPLSSGSGIRCAFEIRASQSSSSTVDLTSDIDASGVSELGFRKAAEADSDGSTFSPTNTISTEVSGKREDLFRPGVLDEDSLIRHMTELTIENDISANTYNFVVAGTADFKPLLDNIKTVHIGSESIDLNSISSTSIPGGFRKTGTATRTQYRALESGRDDFSLKLSFTLKDNTTYVVQLGDISIDLDVAKGFSKATAKLKYNDDDPAIDLDIAGSVDTLFEDNNSVIAYGYQYLAIEEDTKYTPFVLVSTGSSLSDSETLNLKVKLPTSVTFTTYALSREETPIGGNYKYILQESSLLNTIPSILDKPIYDIEISNSDNELHEFTAPVYDKALPKVYARCEIFELGMPVNTLDDNSIRTIGGNDFDLGESYATRVVGGLVDSPDIAVSSGNYATVIKGNKLFRLSKPSRAHANNIINRLVIDSADENQKLKIEAGYEADGLLGSQLGDDFNKFFRSSSITQGFGADGVNLLENKSFNSIRDYLNLSQEEGTIFETSNIKYSQELLDQDDIAINPTLAVPTFNGNNLILGDNKGLFLTSNVPDNPQRDLITSVASRYTASLKPLIFNNKITYLSEQNNLISLVGSEERQGLKTIFSGDEQKHLIHDIIDIIYDYKSRRYYMVRADGDIVTAVDFDENISGYSLIRFGGINRERRIWCKRLFHTEAGVKGLFEVEALDGGELRKRLVIGSFQDGKFIDFEERSDHEGKFEFVSLVISNSIVFSPDSRDLVSSMFLNSLRRISVNISEDMKDLQVGFANSENIETPDFIDYIAKDQNGNRINKYIEAPHVLLEPTRYWESFIILLQSGIDNGGTIYGFQALGDVSGTI